MKNNKKFNNRRKPNRSQQNRRNNGEAEIKQDQAKGSSDQMSSLNDISWYAHNPALLEAAGRIPFAKLPGMTLDLKSLSVALGASSGRQDIVPANKLTIPGMLEIDWLPSVGWSVDNTSPASLAAKELYAKVREKFSGSLDEDAPDILIYMMALDSIYSYIGHLKRIYRTISTYSPMNTMLPDGVCKCMGITSAEATALRKEKTKLWGVINTLVAQSKKFTCPDVMDILRRHYWMSSNIYADANSAKAQFYVFNQTHFYQFNETTETGGSLELIAAPTDHTADGFYTFGDTLISKLAASADAYTINGHLMRAFEGSPSFSVDQLLEGETLDAVYVPEVLSQIHNIRTINSRVTLEDFAITQDPTTNTIIHKPAMTYNGTTSNVNWVTPNENTPVILDLHMDNPTVTDITIASRLAIAVRSVDTTNNKVFLYCGTEIPWSMSVIYYDNTNATYEAFAFSSFIGNAAKTVDATNTLLQALSLLSSFDWHPIVITLAGGTNDAKQIWPFGDIFNITTVDPEVMGDLHRVCVLSEFNAYGIA